MPMTTETNWNKFRSNLIDHRRFSPNTIERSGKVILLYSLLYRLNTWTNLVLQLYFLFLFQCFHVEDLSIFFEGKALSRLRGRMETGVNYNTFICLFDEQEIKSLFDQKYVVQSFSFGESWSWGSWDGNMTIYSDGRYWFNSLNRNTVSTFLKF